MPRNPRADQIGTGGRIKSESLGGCPRNAHFQTHTYDSISFTMQKFVRRLLGSSSKERPRRLERLPQQIRLPVMPFATYVVGDIHGCLDLYGKLEEQIFLDANGGTALIILVGDLIDRGPDSAGVVTRAMGPCPAGVQRLVLMGNHEQMMLQFLDTPRMNFRWLQYGGAETLASYGVPLDQLNWMDGPEDELAQKVQSFIPVDHVEWMRRLPAAAYVGGRYFVSHAGIDPAKPLGAQSIGDLMWSRGMKGLPPKGITVVHGHTPVEMIDLNGPYIDVDTGAYLTGRLSAVKLVPEGTSEVFESS